MRLLYYEAVNFSRHQNLPDIKRFMGYFKLYGQLAPPVDRSGVLKFPVRVKSVFPLPELRVFTPTYEEVCNERAQELLARAERLDTSLYVFWSGGVDSTCLLVSLLKNASAAQQERIVVLMSEESIAEYPLFYQKFIRQQLRRESSMLLPYILGEQCVLVNGEGNDQLFGSDALPKLTNQFGLDVLNEGYKREIFFEFLLRIMGDEGLARFYVCLFERLADGAPIRLKTLFDIFWWINFALKWQTVYMRVLSFVADRNTSLLSSEYVKTYYAPFFDTENFQLWSLNNRNQRMRDGWHSYKWPAKQIIYDFTKDADYCDNKLKRGSLQFLIKERVPFDFIDENFVFRRQVPVEDFYEPDNDFIR
jgi:hypothetical protein